VSQYLPCEGHVPGERAMPQDMAGKLTGSRHGKGLQMSLQVTVCLCVYPLCHTKSQCGSKNAGSTSIKFTDLMLLLQLLT